MEATINSMEDYALQYSKQTDEVLYRLYRETHLKVMNPIMLTGFLQGKLLEHISLMLKPERILEIGTYTGFASICLAKGLKSGGKLITIEKNPELEEICRKYFVLSGFENYIDLKIGNALDVIPNLDFNFDLVYIDCDKELYPSIYDKVFKKVNSGGYILADNVLWHGKINDKKFEADKDTSAIRQFNELVLNDNRVDNFILPLRDGLMIIRKS